MASPGAFSSSWCGFFLLFCFLFYLIACPYLAIDGVVQEQSAVGVHSVEIQSDEASKMNSAGTQPTFPDSKPRSLPPDLALLGMVCL